MSKQKPKFRRTDGHKYSKLGVRRKKLRKYRKPKGGDNKIRLNRAGRVRKVKIGFRSPREQRDLVKGMEVVRIFNAEDLKKIKDNMIGVVGKVGGKNKMKIAEYAKEKKIELLNLDADKFLKKIEEKKIEAKEEKKQREEKRKVRDKKAKEKEKKDGKKEKEKLEEKITDDIRKDRVNEADESEDEDSEDKSSKGGEDNKKEEAVENIKTNIKMEEGK